MWRWWNQDAWYAGSDEERLDTIYYFMTMLRDRRSRLESEVK